MQRPVAAEIAALAAGFHARGWMPATSGNLSAVVSREPLQLAVTPSGADKGSLRPEQILCVDGAGGLVAGTARPSDETPLHLEIVERTGAGAVAHTHSVWATLVSLARARDGGLALEGYELLKALSGVGGHRHREWLPILANSQDYVVLRSQVARVLRDHPHSHGFLLAGHGLYSWGRDLGEARRHTEALEFLLEVEGRAVRPGG